MISKLTSDNIQGMLNALDHPVAAKINEIIDMVNAGGILQDLQSVLDTGSVAAITTPFDIGFGMLDVFDLVAGHGTVHGAFDISSTNTYGPAYPPRDPTAALGPSSFAAGFLNEVTGYAAAAFAGTSKATGSYAFAQGENCEASGYASRAVGDQCKAAHSYTEARGFNCEASYYSALAMGGFCRATAASATAIGNGYWNGGSIYRWLQAHGQGAFNLSSVNGSYGAAQTGASGARSFILGGVNHETEAGSADAMILGGGNVKMETSALRSVAIGLMNAVIADPDKVYLRNLNLWDAVPRDDSLTELLAYKPADKSVQYVDKTSVSMHLGYGATGARPAGLVGTDTGKQYFDTTVGAPIWWNGSGWVDASGSPI